MKTYPKIPRYDHPVVDAAFYESGEFCLTEKMDGSNFKFTLYEDRFADHYDAAVHEAGATDGDVVFGSKTVVRGTDTTDLRDLDGNFHRAVRYLRTTLDRDALRGFQDKYGPLICFAENMVHHTLDYDYRDDPPPPLLGFDVYAPELDPREAIPPDPYEEHFEGFLPTEILLGETSGEQSDFSRSISRATDGYEGYTPDTGEGIFAAIGLNAAPVIERELSAEEFDPAHYEIPKSAWTDDVAEGVIVPKDADHRRVKLVTDAFDELNRQRWGQVRRRLRTAPSALSPATVRTVASGRWSRRCSSKRATSSRARLSRMSTRASSMTSGRRSGAKSNISTSHSILQRWAHSSPSGAPRW
jgi:hypothetical protein